MARIVACGRHFINVTSGSKFLAYLLQYLAIRFLRLGARYAPHPSAITLQAACLRRVRNCDEKVYSIRMPSLSARAEYKPP